MSRGLNQTCFYDSIPFFSCHIKTNVTCVTQPKFSLFVMLIDINIYHVYTKYFIPSFSCHVKTTVTCVTRPKFFIFSMLVHCNVSVFEIIWFFYFKLFLSHKNSLNVQKWPKLFVLIMKNQIFQSYILPCSLNDIMNLSFVLYQIFL